MSPVCFRCGAEFRGRADAAYCGSTCKREAARQRQPVSARKGVALFRWWDLGVRGRVAVARGRSRYAQRRKAADG